MKTFRRCRLLIVLSLALVAMTLTGCEGAQSSSNTTYPNRGYRNYGWTNLSLVQFQLRERVSDGSEVSGWFFLGIGSVNSSGGNQVIQRYYGYVRDQTGATTLVSMPAGLTFIYEDATIDTVRVEAMDLYWSEWDDDARTSTTPHLKAKEWRVHVPLGSISRTISITLFPPIKQPVEK